MPRALKPDEVERLLNSFTAELRWPKRGYAIVRCALDMGLRCCEIANLMISDIDWRAGTVTLEGHEVAAAGHPAVADGRPGRRWPTICSTSGRPPANPAVFVRRCAPRDQPIGVDCHPAGDPRAYRRIGLTHSRSHALRHTLACRLVENGSSLKEVADVLRHRSLNTTLIYAKLDTPKLSAVALPWPGSAS